MNPTSRSSTASPAEALARCSLDTPVGRLTLVASPVGLRAVLWERDDGRVPVTEPVHDAEPGEHPVLALAAAQLLEYFAGERTAFDVPLDPRGTPFQRAVWDVLRTIPHGRTMTYGQQAARLGDPNKARAVGAANGRNPISIIVPCHRVIGAGGALTGFAGGIEVKSWLLAHEQGDRLPGIA